MKQSWINKNAFWVLGTINLFFVGFALDRNKDLAALFFALLAMISILFGLYYETLPNKRKTVLDPFQKAQYHQHRKRVIKLVKETKK